ncbi:MAG: alpha-glycosidase [Firmicutes bacterium]|nr:alpha-glycosidase [Bacillota bacterium]
MDNNEEKRERLNIEAVFSDETRNFRYPEEPTWRDKITVRLRTKKDNADEVFMVWNDVKIKMSVEKSEGIFDYYEGVFLPSDENVKYYFEIKRNDEVFYYSKLGISGQPLRYADFYIVKNFKTPLWSRGSIMYQIYVDRFSNSDKSNDVVDGEYIYWDKPVHFVKNWFEPPSSNDIQNFYGGDLQGVIDKLPYLKNLGVDAIYFNPIFVSPSNHKYDIQDYDHVDPHIGRIVSDGGVPVQSGEKDNKNASKYIKRTTDRKNLIASDELFMELVRKAHGLGMKVILDGVFNHCGDFNKWLNKQKIYKVSEGYEKGAYEDFGSPYRDYFVWNDDGKWPDNYDGWWGFSNHPKLNYEGSQLLFSEIMRIAKKWVMPPYDADGWRVDVAADLGQSAEFNHFFWQEFRKAVKSAKSEAVILAEHYGDPAPWLNGHEWDTIMNYDAFMEPVSFFFCGMEKHGDYFREDLLNNGKAFAVTMVQNMARLPRQTLFTAMNQLSNHDHSRFLTRTNLRCGRLGELKSSDAEMGINAAVFREAVMLQMTWVGSPTIYYGDEAGLCGFTDPDNRRTYPWGCEDISLIEFHRELVYIRKNYPALSFGSTMFLNEDYGIVSYGRFDSRDRIVVAFNNTDDEKLISIPVWRIGVEEGSTMEKLYMTTIEGFGHSGKSFRVINGSISVLLKRRTGVILHEKH